VRSAVAYGKECIARRAVGAALQDAERGVDRRATFTATVGKQNNLEQQVRGAGRPELTGRVTGNRYDWPGQSSGQGDESPRPASLPGELAALLARAGLPMPASATEEADPDERPPSPTGAAAGPTTTEWLYVVSCSVQVLSVAYTNDLKEAVARLERAALDPSSDDAVAGLVAIHSEGPAEDDDIVHVRALLCANEAAATELRKRRAAESRRQDERQRRRAVAERRRRRRRFLSGSRFEEEEEMAVDEDDEDESDDEQVQEELEPFPLDRVLGVYHEGAEPEPERESEGTTHYITSGVGPPWPCMPGCSCATRPEDARAEAGGGTGKSSEEEDVSKVMLGSVGWSLAEDLSMLLQGQEPLLDRIQGKFRASLALAHAWWLHPGYQTDTPSSTDARTQGSENRGSSSHLGRWIYVSSAAAAALRVSTSGTFNMHFVNMRMVRDKLSAVAAAHEALQYWDHLHPAQYWQEQEQQQQPPPPKGGPSGPPTDGFWATGISSHPIWDLLLLSGDELAHRIRSKLLEWCGGLMGKPESLSRSMSGVYSAVVRDVYACTSLELWVVKLECTPPSAGGAGSASGHDNPTVAGSAAESSGQGAPGLDEPTGHYDILAASSVGSAVQIKADLKGCTVPAWLPLPTAKANLPIPEAQPKPEWEAEADWSEDTSEHDSTDLWTADLPGHRAVDGRH
jgi:hypothetical protein